MTIDRIFVAGAGLMGHGIAQVHAKTGHQVVLYEPDVTSAQAERDRTAGNLDRAVAMGRMTPADRDATLARIRITDDTAAASDADLVVEAVSEDVDVKTALWAELDRIAPSATIFASNTSSISIERLAQAFWPARRELFVGMHFFSPVGVMPLVEIIRASETTDATEAAIRQLAERLGKQVIVSADRPGFIINRILMRFLAESMRAFADGLGTAEDIDMGARIGLNHPMGPLELADFIGLDVCHGVMRVLDERLEGDYFAPPRALVELVEAGHLGQKTGQGFYAYPRPERTARLPAS